MTTRDVLVAFTGEDRYEVLRDVAGGNFKNGEAAESRKVADGTMTRTRQKAEAQLGAIRDRWHDLDELIHRLGAEVRDLPNRAFANLRDIRLVSPAEYERLRDEHRGLFKVLEQVQGIHVSDSPAACERACKIYEKLHQELGKLGVGQLGIVDPGEVRRLYAEALDQIDSIRTEWRKLAGLLARLDYHDIRDINLNELRRLTDDGLDLLEVARPKFQKVVELLDKGRPRPGPARGR